MSIYLCTDASVTPHAENSQPSSVFPHCFLLLLHPLRSASPPSSEARRRHLETLFQQRQQKKLQRQEVRMGTFLNLRFRHLTNRSRSHPPTSCSCLLARRCDRSGFLCLRKKKRERERKRKRAGFEFFAPGAPPLAFPGRSSANTLSRVQIHKDTHTLETERERERKPGVHAHTHTQDNGYYQAHLGSSPAPSP